MKPVDMLPSFSGEGELPAQDTQRDTSPMELRRRTKLRLTKYWCIAPDVKFGNNVELAGFIHLYGCEVGENTRIGAFVEIQKNATVGKNCKISSHTFICEGVTIQDNVSVGHGVTFVNHAYPHAAVSASQPQTEKCREKAAVVEQGASIGSGSTILSNLTIGTNATVGAGSVVILDVPPNAFVTGNPAKALEDFGGKPSLAASIPSQIPFDGPIPPDLELQEELLSVFRAALAEITRGRIIQLKKVIQQEGKELERRIIARVLENNGWNRRLTARALSISYGALLQKMKETGLLPKRRTQFDEIGPALNWLAAGTRKVGRQDADHQDSVSQP